MAVILLAVVSAAYVTQGVGSSSEVEMPRPIAGAFDDLAPVMRTVRDQRDPGDILTPRAERTVAALEVRGAVSRTSAAQSRKVLDDPRVGKRWVVPAVRGFAVVSETDRYFAGQQPWVQPASSRAGIQ
jgi:hypothetical protein